MNLGLEGRNALVTGATRGIGKAVAVGLAKEGVNLALFCRDQALGEEVAAELGEQFPESTVVVVCADLGMNEGVARAVDEAARALGGLDIVVNAAGGSARGGLGAVAAEEWHRRLDAKPLGLIAVCAAAAPHLEKSEAARIVNLSGLHGTEPPPWAAMAGVVNAGVLGFSKAIAGELGPKGITVNVVSPGFTSGRRFDELIEITARDRGSDANEAEAWLRSLVPLGRPADPDEVAAMVIFLASAQAAMITGCEFRVDGGRAKSI